MSKGWFITGASRGFGHIWAEAALDRGDRVVATARDVSTLEPMLEDLHSRLAGVVIECLDWADFIPRYDSADTLLYLDPPYWGCEDDYGKAMFARADFERLAQQLARPGE